jgi:hypothetical protein
MDMDKPDREVELLKALEGLITNISRADGQSWQDAFLNSTKYIEVRQTMHQDPCIAYALW